MNALKRKAVLCRLGVHRPLFQHEYTFTDVVSNRKVYKAVCPCGAHWLVDSRRGWLGFTVLVGSDDIPVSFWHACARTAKAVCVRIQITYLKRKTRRSYIKYYKARDKLSCGEQLADAFPSVAEHKNRFNALMDRLAEIDPDTPVMRL